MPTLIQKARAALYLDPQARRVRTWRRDGGDESLRLDYDLTPDSVVVDLGGYEGAWANDIFERYGCTIHVFEPMPAFAEAISRRFATNGKVHVHALGLGGRTGTASLSTDADASSMLRGDGGEIVRIERALPYLEEHGVHAIDLLKVNIEGAEYDLLEHMLDGGFMPHVRDLQVQFHDFAPDAASRMARIQRRLAETHDPTYQYEWVWENWRCRES